MKNYFNLQKFSMKKESRRGEKRFRGSIYVDFFVDTEDTEKGREVVLNRLKRLSEKIPNAYVGDAAYMVNNVSPDRDI